MGTDTGVRVASRCCAAARVLLIRRGPRLRSRPGERPVPDPHSIDPLDPVVAAVIRRKAATIARILARPGYGQDDAAQDLRLALLARRAKYDPARGDPGAFIHTVLSHAAADLCRAGRTEKRRPPLPLEAIGDLPDDDLWLLLDQTLDVTEAIAGLPSGFQVIANGLKVLTIADLSREQEQTRAWVYSRIRAIRSFFERQGLRDYLEKLPALRDETG